MRMKATSLLRTVWAAMRAARGALVLVLGSLVLAAPAAAQFWGNPFEIRRPQRPIPQQQNPFGNPFGGGGGGGGFFGNPFWEQPPRQHRPRPQVIDASKAPAPRKADTPPTTNILVMGDAMADWLGHGLEEAYADNAEFGVTRKIRANSGLVRNETSRTESYDWVQAAREAQERADFVVIMLGLSDRQSIRERQAARPAQQQGAQAGQTGDQQQQQQPSGTHEFRSEKWGELYAKRLDDMIAAAKSKGVPVLWVGLPPIRGARAKTDLTYLNDIYKASALKAGITFVDVWDGFADEDGNFNLRGPDYNGQIRQLRSGDGVYFTKAGALKLGHYVEREIQRLIATRAVPVALPAPEPAQQAPARPGAPAPRPVAGPVVPLTGAASAPEELMGGSSARAAASSDPITTQVLVRGEPPPRAAGRADDFAWPRPDPDADAIIPVVATPAAPPAAQRPVASAGKKGAPTPPPPEQRKAAPKKRPGQSAAAQQPQPAPFAFPQNPFQFGGPSPARPPR
jgi:uncharacterized protein